MCAGCSWFHVHHTYFMVPSWSTSCWLPKICPMLKSLCKVGYSVERTHGVLIFRHAMWYTAQESPVQVQQSWLVIWWKGSRTLLVAQQSSPQSRNINLHSALWWFICPFLSLPRLILVHIHVVYLIYHRDVKSTKEVSRLTKKTVGLPWSDPLHYGVP